MQLMIVVQNIGRGALKTGNGTWQDRWPLLVERIAPLRPDLLLVQEAEGWAADGSVQLVRAEQDLDMDGILTPSRSGLGPALLYRRKTLGRRTSCNADYGMDETHHGFGVAGFTLPGLPAPLSVASVHLTPYSADKAVMEADFAASRLYRLGPYGILGGDINFPPQAGPEPNYQEMRPYNAGSRTVTTDPALKEALQPDRRVAWKLHANGLRDVAWELCQRSGNETLLAATGTDDRIDQAWVTAPLVPAIVSYQLLTEPSGASDHHGLAVVIDTDAIDIDRPWTYR